MIALVALSACTPEPGVFEPPVLEMPTCPDDGPITPFDATSETGFRRGDRVGDVTLALLDGSEFVLSEHFDGCEQYGFLPQRDGSTDPAWPDLWERDLRKLLNRSPTDVTWLFFTDADPRRPELNALQDELDQMVGNLDDDEAEHWQDRLLVVDKLSGWVAEKWDTTGYGFLVGRDQRLRDVGSLADPERFDGTIGWFEGNISYAANEAVYADFLVERQRALDAEDDITIVEVFDELLIEGADEVVLDLELGDYDTMAFDLSLGCDGDREFGNCPAWDYLVYLHECGIADDDDADWAEQVCTPDETAACACTEPDGSRSDVVRTCNADGTAYSACPCRCEEIGRWITPYHREGRWVHDVSPMLSWLNDGGPQRLKFTTSQPYTVDLDLRLAQRQGLGPPDPMTFLFAGGTFDDDYNVAYETQTLAVPADAKKVELVAIISGHGFGANEDNCAEFCNHTHHFTVNGTEFVKAHPEVDNTEGCVDQVAIGTSPNQFGTWFYGRGGWCPGLEVQPWVVDVTEHVTAGEDATVSYEGRLDGEPYVERPTSGTFAARIDMLSYWVVTR